MPVINDFPWPAPTPRRGPGPRLQPPHPASGSAPSILEILAEAATLNPPHPSVIPEGDVGRIAGIVNNPSAMNVPGEELAEAAGNLATTYVSTGKMPALEGTFRQELSDAIIQQLDAEARMYPSLSRMLLRGSNAPTIDDLFAIEGGPAKISPFFEGAVAGDNPDVTQGKIQQLLKNLDEADPVALEADRLAVEETTAGTENIYEGYEPFLETSIPQPLNKFRELLEALWILNGSEEIPPDSITSIVHLLETDSMSRGRMQDSALDALTLSNIGSGKAVPGLDNISRRSLAPDFDPEIMSRELGQNQEDPEILMKLLGLERRFPRADR